MNRATARSCQAATAPAKAKADSIARRTVPDSARGAYRLRPYLAADPRARRAEPRLRRPQGGNGGPVLLCRDGCPTGPTSCIATTSRSARPIDFLPAAAEDYALSFDGKKLLYQGAAPTGQPNGQWAVVDAGGDPPAAGHGALATQSLRMDLDPLAEWRQIFDEAWRIERDYLYVANMHGADWPALKTEVRSRLCRRCATAPTSASC